MEGMRFNVSIARITELNNHLTARYPDGGVPRAVIEPLVLLLAPLAPHISEELWSRLGHAHSLADEPFPVADAALLAADTVEIPVRLNGKVRARVHVPADADAEAVEAAARADQRVAALLEGAEVRRVIAVPGRLINFLVELIITEKRSTECWRGEFRRKRWLPVPTQDFTSAVRPAGRIGSSVAE